MAKNEYEKVGGGQYGVYRQKKKTDWGSILGGIVVAVVAIVIIANL